jgi:hypothetical protein
VDQHGLRQFGEQAGDPQDAVPVRRAAALEGRIGMDEAELARARAAERVGPAILPVAAQVDDRAQPVAPLRLGKLPGQRVVRAEQPPRLHHAPVAPGDAQHGVVHQQAVEPGAAAAGGGGQVGHGADMAAPAPEGQTGMATHWKRTAGGNGRG